MRSYLEVPRKWYRIAFVLVLVPLCSAWTCNAFVRFDSCQTSVPQPQIAALSPDGIPIDASSVQLIVEGNGFVRQSEILWNGNPLQTTFTDSGHLQTTITREMHRRTELCVPVMPVRMPLSSNDDDAGQSEDHNDHA